MTNQHPQERQPHNGPIIGEGSSGVITLIARKTFHQPDVCEHERAMLQIIRDAGVRQVIGVINLDPIPNAIDMQYFPHPTLEHFIAIGNPVSIGYSRILRIVQQLEEFLEDMDRAGLVHGDFKAKNILIDPTTDTVRIIDFDRSAASTELNQHHDDDLFVRLLLQLYFWIPYTETYIAAAEDEDEVDEEKTMDLILELLEDVEEDYMEIIQSFNTKFGPVCGGEKYAAKPIGQAMPTG